MFARIAVLLISLLVAACNTVQIIESPPMQPPPGLSADQVGAAIRAAITKSNRSSTWAGGSWVVEDSQPGLITAGLRVRAHYLQLAIAYSESRVTTKITGSQNLKQDDDSIHRKALGWQRRLESYLYQELGRVASDPKSVSEKSAPRLSPDAVGIASLQQGGG